MPNIPYQLLLSASYPIEVGSRLLRLQQPISPVRIRKLVCSNNIVPACLRRSGYVYPYNLEEALVDWCQERSADWGKDNSQ